MREEKSITGQPIVSIILPVYNSEDYLYRCMDSLVYQSFQNIEIIAVNNGSTDNSLHILKQYEAEFPDIVKVVTIPHAERAGTGRNVGIKLARGQYIAFSDSDDMMHPRAIEFLYQHAISGNFDLVYAPYIQIKNNIVKVMRKKDYATSRIKTEQALQDAEPAPWAKIFRRELLERAGDYPGEFSFEDLAYFFVYTSYAQKIGYCPLPIYYYFWRTDSEVHTIANPRIAETILAERYGLEHCAAKYKECVLAIVARRIQNNLSVRWIFADKFLEHLNTLWSEFSTNPRIYNDKSLFAFLAQHYSYSINQAPKNIFIDCFGGKELSPSDIATLQAQVYYDDSTVYLLNECTCNVDELPNIRIAYERGDMAYVAGYFALKKIYELGGVYIGRDIQVDLPLNYTRHLNAFFGFVGREKYSDQIFGGKANTEIFADLLRYYQKESSCNHITNLAHYISTALYIKFAIPPYAATNIHGRDIAVFTPDVIAVPIFSQTYVENKIHFCHYSCSGHENEKALKSALYTVPAEVLEWASEKSLQPSGTSTSKQLSSIEDELRKITSSRAWKTVLWLKGKKDSGFGRIAYKLYLFLYRKIFKN